MSKYIENAKEWTNSYFDEKTQLTVQDLLENNPSELEDAFYKNMEFGTGGMRGIMGVGINRINKYTLGMATQGLSNYIKEQFPSKKTSVAIAYDCRHNSSSFAKIVADIFTANGIKVYLFSSLRPTPELSFAVRELKCEAGIVLTASHNPPEYNGYKVYWSDGSQIVPPHDKNIISEVTKVTVEDIKFEGSDDLIEYIDTEIDELFTSKCAEEGVFTTADKSNIDIAFTSIHGTSIKSIPQAFAKAGFTNVHIVEEQAEPNGDFPTVVSPNPEEPEALKMAMDLAEEKNCDIVIGTDPDADRIGIAVRNLDGEMTLLNGNQANTVFIHFLLNQHKEKGLLKGKELIGTTIVSSDIFFKLAADFKVEIANVLTGFKWIANAIRENEGKLKFIGGGEESFGFLVGDFVRDKDSVTAAVLAAEIAAYCKANNTSIYEYLLDIYTEYGCFQEQLIAIVKKGISGADEISEMMVEFRNNPPTDLAGSPIVEIRDYHKGTITNLKNNTTEPTNIPSSNVLIFYSEDGTKLACRPSGTEPKIKFYFSANTSMESRTDYTEVLAKLNTRIESIITQLKLK